MVSARSHREAFTLVELLLVICIVAILASIVIVSINPKKQYGDARDTQRRADVNTILNAIAEYAAQHKGKLPPAITTNSLQICQTAAASCGGYADLSVLTTSGAYLPKIPIDPQIDSGTGGTRYYVQKNANGTVTVTAPGAENTTSISVSR